MINADLTTTMQRAKNSLKKSATAKAGAAVQNKNYRVIPGFKDYGLLPGGELISLKTNKVQQIPNGKKKYLIFNSKGERRSIGLDEIKEKLKSVEKPIKNTKVKGEKGETKKERILNLYKDGKNYKEIADSLEIPYNTVYVTIKVNTILSLNKKGYTPKQIAEKTGYSEDSVIWQINK